MTIHEFRAMGSQILAILDAPAALAGAQLNNIQTCFATWEQILSRFRPASELSRLNHTAGGWVSVSATLAMVLGVALDAAQQTDGLVTPTLLDALEQVGYNCDFSTLANRELGDQSPHQPTMQLADWRAIRLDRQKKRVYLPHGFRLDLGGVTKGWAADRAAHSLKQVGPALVDAGGDIAVNRPRADGTPWPIAVSDPYGSDTPLDLLLLNAGGVATSGRDYRRWRQGNHERHHIIDPRTGIPAETDLLSVTIVAASATEAEVAAKAVLILGSNTGLDWLAIRPALAGLLVHANGTITRTATLDAYRWTPERSAHSIRSLA